MGSSISHGAAGRSKRRGPFDAQNPAARVRHPRTFGRPKSVGFRRIFPRKSFISSPTAQNTRTAAHRDCICSWCPPLTRGRAGTGRHAQSGFWPDISSSITYYIKIRQIKGLPAPLTLFTENFGLFYFTGVVSAGLSQSGKGSIESGSFAQSTVELPTEPVYKTLADAHSIGPPQIINLGKNRPIISTSIGIPIPVVLTTHVAGAAIGDQGLAAIPLAAIDPTIRVTDEAAPYFEISYGPGLYDNGSAANPPNISSNSIVPIYSTMSTIQPGEWVSIYGTNLASGPTTWNGDFPTSLGGNKRNN